ncbi:methyl-accepting chemotaxis protein [Gorillibacterium massiliense]|uniref:methyl-accepting chemotaxis protein n=1 Tax=Gorillibacterium massiliense TaxID=1280390 RepID=UPI0004BAF3FC|nr:methyl-accepting chemotaxis protein [Gorillibacterium massiliense]
MTIIKRITRLTLTGRLVAGFATILAVFILVAVFNLQQMEQIRKQMAIQNDTTDLKQTALAFKVLVQEMKDASSGYMISGDEAFKTKFEKDRVEYKAILDKISSHAVTKEQFQARSRMIIASDGFLETYDRAVNLMKQSNYSEADLKQNIQFIYDESDEMKTDIFKAVDQFYQDFSKAQEAAVANSLSRMDRTVTVMTVAPFLVLLISIAVAFLLARSVLVPVRRLGTAVQQIAAGDLSHRIDSKDEDELGKLSGGFDQMADRVEAMIGEVRSIAASLSDSSSSYRESSRDTADASGRIASTIQNVSASANSQAVLAERSAALLTDLNADLQGIGASADEMQLMSSSAQESADLCEASVQELGKAASKSEELIEKAVTAMRHLAASTGKIGSINAAIADISSQTSLLALNAAIEAATAGQYGLGFSVIAGEVRKLSGQAHESAKQIAALVQALGEQTTVAERDLLEARTGLYEQNSRVALTNTAFHAISEALTEIATHVPAVHGRISEANRKSTGLAEAVEEVAAAAEETAAGSEEITHAAIRQNEAVQQIADEAEHLHALSASLYTEIGKFRTA